MKRILIGMIAVMMVMPVFAEDTPAVGDKTTTSQPYVKTQVDLKQGLIPAAGTNNALGDTVVTYTSNGEGEIGERGIYTGGTYDASTDADKLITASALNTAFTTLPTTDTTTLECANPGTCTLWTIVDQTAYGESITLPAGYTHLEYIQTMGGQYINTGFVPTTDENIEMEIRYDAVTGSNYIFQARSSAGLFGLTGSTNGNTLNGTCAGTSVRSDIVRTTGMQLYQKLTFADNKITLYTKDLTNNMESSPFVSYNSTGAYPLPGTPICLFGNTNGNTIPSGVRIYYARMKINGEYKLNVIPVKNSSSVVGMYDLVSNTFLTDANHRTFIAGPAVN